MQEIWHTAKRSASVPDGLPSKVANATDARQSSTAPAKLPPKVFETCPFAGALESEWRHARFAALRRVRMLFNRNRGPTAGWRLQGHCRSAGQPSLHRQGNAESMQASTPWQRRVGFAVHMPPSGDKLPCMATMCALPNN